jgi:hypothetical protein
MHPIPHALCVALAAALPAFAQDPPADPDADALLLADKPADEAKPASPWRAYAEIAAGREGWGGGASSTDSARAALDLRYDGTLSPGWRAVLSNRTDFVRSGSPRTQRNVNSLREAYLSWQRNPQQIFDLGRVNVRHGAAWGFNPTDYFRADALRAIVSPDPAALRENRLGTVVLRGQQLWSDGAVSLALSPRLKRERSDAAASPDFGATNNRHRWLLTGSRKLGGLNPQLLLHGGESTPTQLGFNLSGLLGNATVAFLEFSSGRGPSLASQARGLAEPDRTRRRAALGLTYTTGFNLSLTAELDHNSAAPDRAQWNALGPLERLRLLDLAQRTQDLPVRQAVFLYATWKDALVRRLDLSGFVRHEPLTDSRAQWLEARYRWERADLSLQWQHHSGSADSVFGTIPRERAVELALRWYL